MFYVHPTELLKIFLWEGKWVLLYFNLCADCLIWINQTFVMMSYSFSKIINGRQVLISSDFQVAPCGACLCGPFEFFSIRSVKKCQLHCLTRLSLKKEKLAELLYFASKIGMLSSFVYDFVFNLVCIDPDDEEATWLERGISSAQSFKSH